MNLRNCCLCGASEQLFHPNKSRYDKRMLFLWSFSSLSKRDLSNELNEMNN